MRANNDPSEQNFAVFTNVLEAGGRIDLKTAAGKGQSRYNHDFERNHRDLVTCRKSKKKDADPPSIGTFHELRLELQDSLVITYKRHTDTGRKDFAGKIA